MMRKRLGIYIHIPFCVSKCGYCDFYSVPGGKQRMPDYQSALLSHISESAGNISAYEVDSIYIGGGTPSCYGAQRIVEILDELKRIGNVRLDSEITMEVNPDTVRLDDLKLLRREGVDRLSIGVQSANNDILKMIGRRHNFKQAQMAVENARRAGFENVSLDLIYGLPSQTKGDWAETLQACIELHPEHLSCYGLKLEEGTPMYHSYLNSPLLPDDDEQADMYLYTVEALSHYGYKQYEISNFAVPGYESRHNLKYWQLDDYMGFGPGAHSCVGNLRYSYVRSLDKYISAVNGDSMIIDEYEEIVPCSVPPSISCSACARPTASPRPSTTECTSATGHRLSKSFRNLRSRAGRKRPGTAGASLRRVCSFQTRSSTRSSRRRPAPRSR